ncbi:hypothetical protein J7K56_01295 [Candidatus Calescamantes bacterium]|nr:hypothetical protein [Candidatus Calescamantes bacterium]
MAVGRFQVMAVLQAARAYRLGLPLESAKSWGLNRAIFYAAAKKGLFKRKLTPGEVTPPLIKGWTEEKVKEAVEKTFKITNLGDEMGYSIEIDGKPFFVIGGKVQTPEDFHKQIEAKFGDKFEEAWKEALEIVGKYDEGILRSQRYFYELVYKPRRDELAKKWTEIVSK